jgi:hypothetical protein
MSIDNTMSYVNIIRWTNIINRQDLSAQSHVEKPGKGIAALENGYTPGYIENDVSARQLRKDNVSSYDDFDVLLTLSINRCVE